MTRSILVAAALTALLAAAATAAPPIEEKVLCIGFDGMDPQFLQQFVDEGKMPNFARLMAEGDIRELGTAVPPQSPVAWSTFITGQDPGGHGIFDLHQIAAVTDPCMQRIARTGDVGALKRHVGIGQGRQAQINKGAGQRAGAMPAMGCFCHKRSPKICMYCSICAPQRSRADVPEDQPPYQPAVISTVWLKSSPGAQPI